MEKKEIMYQNVVILSQRIKYEITNYDIDFVYSV